MKKAISVLILLLPCVGLAQERTDEAVEMLKTLCVSPAGNELEIRAEGGGGLTIRNLGKAGITGNVTIERRDIEGFVDGISTEISAQQASEIRSCMRPYIGTIMKIVLGTSEDAPGKSWVHIQRIEKSLTTDNHHCSSNCRGEPTRTGYTISLTAPESRDRNPRMLRKPKLECRAGPCGGWNQVMLQPRIAPNGLSASTSFDVWSKPTTWILSADYYEFK